MWFNYSFYNIVLKESANFVYLYNSYSGALCKLEKAIHSQILNEEIDDNIKCEYFEQLLNQGFIKPVDLNEYNRIILNERIAILSNPQNTLSYVIAPTLACNLNCDYCFESGYRNNSIVNDAKIIEIADYILSRINAEVKTINVGWFGGEPLVAYNQILKFSNYIIPKLREKEVSFSSSMITNGVLLSKDKVKALAEQCNLKRVQITVDGTKNVYCARKHATPNQFDTLLKNIKEASNFIKISIRLNCDKNNFDDLKAVANKIIEQCDNKKNLSIYLAKLIDYMGCGGDQFFSQDAFDNKRIDFDKYICELLGKPYEPNIYKYRKSFCGLFKLNNHVIGPNGELYKCEHHVGQAEKVIGDIKYGLNYNDTFMRFLENKPLEMCKKCKIFPICLGGCPAQKFDLPQGESCFYSEFYIKKLFDRFIND